jgi:hypothetical protein
MSDVPESDAFIQVEAIQFLAAASESTMTAIAAAINYALTRTKLTNEITLGFMEDSTVHSSSWVAPANLVGGIVIVLGAGGGGGGGGGISVSGTTIGQGGGGSDLAPRVFFVTPGNTYTYAVGAGGGGGVGSANGSNGNNTIFNGTNVGRGGRGGIGTQAQSDALTPPNGQTFMASIFGNFGHGVGGGLPGTRTSSASIAGAALPRAVSEG